MQPACLRASASLNVAYLDTTVAPGADFYTYVNKGWMEAHPLTAEHARYGQFDILNDSSENRVKELIANLGTTNPEPGTVAHKVRPSTRRLWTPPAATARAQLPSSPTSRKSRKLRMKGWKTSSSRCTETTQAPSSEPVRWKISPTRRSTPCISPTEAWVRATAIIICLTTSATPLSATPTGN